jgi:small subunit ribosomal protein S20
LTKINNYNKLQNKFFITTYLNEGKDMPHNKSAKKRIRKSQKQRLINRQYKSKLSTLTKEVRKAASKKEAEKALKSVIPCLDKLATKGIIHHNKAANQKSKLTKFVTKFSE